VSLHSDTTISNFKAELRIGSKLSIVFTAEEFEDWHDRFVGLLEDRNLFECLHDAEKTGINCKEDQAMHILRENVEYAQFKEIFKQSSHISQVWSALCKRWDRSSVARLGSF
jgi:hypothetical protein